MHSVFMHVILTEETYKISGKRDGKFFLQENLYKMNIFIIKVNKNMKSLMLS